MMRMMATGARLFADDTCKDTVRRRKENVEDVVNNLKYKLPFDWHFRYRHVGDDHNKLSNSLPSFEDLVALVLDMSRTCPGLVPTLPVLGQNTVFMGTQDRLQNVSHGSVTCPSCPAT